jgi:hypothetical protein
MHRCPKKPLIGENAAKDTFNLSQFLARGRIASLAVWALPQFLSVKDIYFFTGLETSLVLLIS